MTNSRGHGRYMSKVLEQTHCPRHDCGSSDAFTVYTRGDGTYDATCFSCGTYFNFVNDDIARYKDTATGRVIELPRHEEVKTIHNGNTFSPAESSPVPQNIGAAKLTVSEALDHPVPQVA